MKVNTEIITRIAPSPTGPFHLGSARTALFNYVFSKKNNGKFYIRVEDTDKERSEPKYIKDAIKSLNLLGMKADKIFFQSRRGQLYKKELLRMVHEGNAYISKEPSKADAKIEVEVVRFKNRGGVIRFNDTVRGEIKIDITNDGDFVIARNIDSPLYNFAVVVDDHDMGITNVIRGDDHISNTPRQILILEALGYGRPVYTHIPLIHSVGGGKLSKRKHATAITDYMSDGYRPDAMCNYLAMLGWSEKKDDREIYSMAELVRAFSLDNLQKKEAIFDLNKLNWFNMQYMQKLTDLQFRKKLALEPLKKYSLKAILKPKSVHYMLMDARERFSTFLLVKEAIHNGEYDYLFLKPILDKKEISWKETDDVITGKHIEHIVSLMEGIEIWDRDKIKDAIMPYAKEKGNGEVLWPLRYSLSGRKKSPDSIFLLLALSRNESTERLKLAIGLLKD